MRVKIRQKDGKWYVFINHHGQRKAKCVGDCKRAAEEVKCKLEAKLTLGDVGLLDAAPQAVLFGDYVEPWLTHYVTVACKPSPVRACAKGKHWGCTGRIFSWGRTPTTHTDFCMCSGPTIPCTIRLTPQRTARADVSTCPRNSGPCSSNSATSALMQPCSTAPRLSPRWCSVGPIVGRCHPPGSTNSIGASVSSPVCMATASTISGIATRRSNSMSTMPPSNMSQSSWDMPVSRSLWIPTDILAKEPALPWPIGLTP